MTLFLHVIEKEIIIMVLTIHLSTSIYYFASKLWSIQLMVNF